MITATLLYGALGIMSRIETENCELQTETETCCGEQLIKQTLNKNVRSAYCYCYYLLPLLL